MAWDSWMHDDRNPWGRMARGFAAGAGQQIQNEQTMKMLEELMKSSAPGAMPEAGADSTPNTMSMGPAGQMSGLPSGGKSGAGAGLMGLLGGNLSAGKEAGSFPPVPSTPLAGVHRPSTPGQAPKPVTPPDPSFFTQGQPTPGKRFTSNRRRPRDEYPPY